MKNFSENPLSLPTPYSSAGKSLALTWCVAWTFLLGGCIFLLYVRRADAMFTAALPTVWLVLASCFVLTMTIFTHYLLIRCFARVLTKQTPLLSPAGYVFTAWNFLLPTLLLALAHTIHVPGTAALGHAVCRLCCPIDIFLLGLLLTCAFHRTAGQDQKLPQSPDQEALLAPQLSAIPQAIPEIISEVVSGEETKDDWQENNWSEGEEEIDEEESEASEVMLPPGVTQQLSRSQTATGDVLEGLLRAVFSPAETRTSLHVAFCPPFAKTPLITCYALQGDIKIETPVHSTPHGVGIHVKKMYDTAEAILFFQAETPADTHNET